MVLLGAMANGTLAAWLWGLGSVLRFREGWLRSSRRMARGSGYGKVLWLLGCTAGNWYWRMAAVAALAIPKYCPGYLWLSHGWHLLVNGKNLSTCSSLLLDILLKTLAPFHCSHR